MIKMKNLCLKLVKCSSADDVKEILKKEGLWDDEKYWKHIGGVENNYTTIGNQQASPLNAFVLFKKFPSVITESKAK